MTRQTVAALLAVLVALTLVGAPVTMADWGEQASLSVESISSSQVDAETPVLRFEDLSPQTQRVVRRAIESPDGSHVVYGWEDAPDRFVYSDYAEPGYGMYVVVYEGQYYRLTTYAAGGFPFVHWLMEIPFVVYGTLLGWVGSRTYLGTRSPRTAVGLAGIGVVFHLLGPEFDFPIVAPRQFAALGLLTTAATIGWLLWSRQDDEVSIE